MNYLHSDMSFVRNFTLPDFQAKTFSPSISLNFNSFCDKSTKLSANGEIYTAGKNFTLPPAVTGWTNLCLNCFHCFHRSHCLHCLSSFGAKRLLCLCICIYDMAFQVFLRAWHLVIFRADQSKNHPVHSSCHSNIQSPIHHVSHAFIFSSSLPCSHCSAHPIFASHRRSP